MLFTTATQLHYDDCYLMNTSHAMNVEETWSRIFIMGNRTLCCLHTRHSVNASPFQPSASPPHLEAHCYHHKQHNKHFEGSDPNQVLCASDVTLPAVQRRTVTSNHLFQSDIPGPSSFRCHQTTRTFYSSWTRSSIRRGDFVCILPPIPNLSKSWSTNYLQPFSVCTMQSLRVRNLFKPPQQQV
jgi:hypothetical protein